MALRKVLLISFWFIIFIMSLIIFGRFYLERLYTMVTYYPKEISSFEVVIARYNEDLSWIITEFPNEKVIVYNKGKDDLNLPSNCNIVKLPNIGRESHTYLYHIVNNYASLADRTLFLQGNPYSATEAKWVFFPLSKYKKIESTACSNIIAASCFIGYMNDVDEDLSCLEDLKWHDTIRKEDNFIEFRNKFIPQKHILDLFFFMMYGANFAVDKNKIFRHDINYYKKILNTLDNIAPIEGHYLERSWDILFQK